MILRTTYDGTGGGVAEDRRFYYCQNWRADVSVVLDDAGVQQERVIYSPYGQPFAMPAGDTNFDGDFEAGVDGDELADWDINGVPYRAYADVNLDGSVNSADATAASEHDLGWNVLTSDGASGVNNRLGYAGYIHDRDVATAAHVRYRVYKIDLGRWMQRDPAGYVDGMSLYEYAASSPVLFVDPMGLCVGDCLGCLGSITVSGTAWAAWAWLCILDPEPVSKSGCIFALLTAIGASLTSIPGCEACAACLFGSSEKEEDEDQNVIPTPPGTPIIRTPPGQRTGAPPPLWPSTCTQQSTSMSSCVNCCWRNHAEEARQCGNEYLAEVKKCDNRIFWRPGWGTCYEDAKDRYRECMNDTGWNYTDCVTNCQSKYYPEPTKWIPERLLPGVSVGSGGISID